MEALFVLIGTLVGSLAITFLLTRLSNLIISKIIPQLNKINIAIISFVIITPLILVLAALTMGITAIMYIPCMIVWLVYDLIWASMKPSKVTVSSGASTQKTSDQKSFVLKTRKSLFQNEYFSADRGAMIKWYNEGRIRPYDHIWDPTLKKWKYALSSQIIYDVELTPLQQNGILMVRRTSGEHNEEWKVDKTTLLQWISEGRIVSTDQILNPNTDQWCNVKDLTFRR